MLPFAPGFLSYRLLTKHINIKTQRAIILRVVYGCETWSVTIRKEYELRVFENRIPSNIFQPKRVEVLGEWRRLHNEELHDLYCSPDIIRAIEWRRMRGAGHVARVERQKVLEIKSYSAITLSCEVSSFYCFCAAG